MIIKRITAVFLIAVMCITAFAACTNNKQEEKYIMTMNGVQYEVTPFSFYAHFLRDTVYQNALKQGVDFNSYLESQADSDGTLVWEMLMDDLKNKSYLEYIFIQQKFDEFGLSFSEDDLKNIDEYFNQMITDHKKNNGDEIIDSILNGVGMTMDDFKKFTAELDQKKTALYNHYFGEGKEFEIKEETLKEEYDEKYRRFKYCIISKMDEQGNLLKVTELTEVQKTADKVFADAKKKDSEFENLIKKYSAAYLKAEDNASEDEKKSIEEYNKTMVEDGWITNANGVFNYALYHYGQVIDQQIVKEVYEMDVGDVDIIELDNAFWIVKLYDSNEKDSYFDGKKSELLTSMISPKFEQLFNDWKNNVHCDFNEDVVNEFDIRNLSTVFFSEEKLKEAIKSSMSSSNK